MKKCKYCKVQKPIEEFYSFKSNGKEKLTIDCKSCNTTRRAANNMRVKIEAINYLGGKCEKCGYDKNPKALDFHHKDPNKKDFSISKYQKLNIEGLINEINKCILLCANCHREEHDLIWKRSDFFNSDLYYFILEKSLSKRAAENKVTFKCKQCFKEISKGSKFCVSCNGINQEKIQWPKRDDLKKLVWKKPMAVLSKELKVSDKAIKKRCIKLNITTPPRGYWLRKNNN